MYHVSAQGVDERMINVHYYYYAWMSDCWFTQRVLNIHRSGYNAV